MMTLKTKSLLALSVAALLLGSSAVAAEKRIKRSELPAAVQKTVDEQSKGAAIRGYAKDVEDGKLEYEVQMTVDGHSKDITIDGQGNLLEIEEEVAMDALPSTIRDGLKAKAGKGTIKKVETLTKGGKLVAYEADVVKGKKHSEVQVGPDGKALAQKQ